MYPSKWLASFYREIKRYFRIDPETILAAKHTAAGNDSQANKTVIVPGFKGNTLGKTTYWEDRYYSMSQNEKEQLLNTFKCQKNALSAEESELMECIAEKEKDSELRYRAFTILQAQTQFKKEETSPTVEEHTGTTELPLFTHSVFYPLYEYASDLDSRLILLTEAAEIGDHKELPFLEKMVTEKNRLIREKAIWAKKIVEERLQEPNVSKDFYDTSPERSDTAATGKNDDPRLPLELLFLYEETGILPAKEDHQDIALFDFDLSEAFAPKPKLPR